MAETVFGASLYQSRIKVNEKVNPVPRTYVRRFGQLPFGEVQNILSAHSRAGRSVVRGRAIKNTEKGRRRTDT